MTDNRKNAYRYLLYHFLLEIRTVPIPDQPLKDNFQHVAHHSYVAGAIAYLLHTLALMAAMDFKEFNEDSFWDMLKSFSNSNPAIDVSHYRKAFEDRLRELGS